MSRRTPLRPTWIASAALTVLASGAVAAVSLVTAAPAALTAAAQPPADAARVVAAFRTAPEPVRLNASSPGPSPSAAPARAAVRAASGRPAGALPAARPAALRTGNPLCEGAGWQQRRGEAAVSRLRRPADARAVTVAFRAARPDVLGLAHLRERRVEVFVRSCASQSDARLLHVVAHELGHLVDAVRLTSELRDQWLAARGIPAGTPWFGCDGCTDFATPAGDFAETYAQWQRGATTSRSQLAPAPSRAQLHALAARFFAPL